MPWAIYEHQSQSIGLASEVPQAACTLCQPPCAMASACGTGSSLHATGSMSPKAGTVHGIHDAQAGPSAMDVAHNTGGVLHIVPCQIALCASSGKTA